MTTIAHRFIASAEADPDGIAVVCGDRSYTFTEIARMSDRFAHGLAGLGIEAGTRIACMIPPGPDFFALAYAVFKIGAVPVLIDAGMDLETLGDCLDKASPDVFLGIPLAHQARQHLGWGERTVRVDLTVGEVGDWGGSSAYDFPDSDTPFPPADLADDALAMILYTTGSTGPAKGARFTHANVSAQFEILVELFAMLPGRVDMPTLPTVAPYTVAAGMTSVIPDMDFTQPGKVDAARLIAQIREHSVTSMFGSPALLDRLGRYGVDHNISLPSLRRVLAAAAPVPPAVLERVSRLLADDAELVVFYGATESLPVAVIDASEVLGETAEGWANGGGTCVGRPVPSIRAAVMPISDEPVEVFDSAGALPIGEIGELAVSGPVVSEGYVSQPEADAAAKMLDAETGRIWHRLGDAVKVDERGRLWFQGRVAHRVLTADGTLFPIPVEAVFNQHPRVYRTALVGVGVAGVAHPVLCVEMEAGEPRDGGYEVREELLERGAAHGHTAGIRDVLFHDRFPVDIRHNSKIFREKLAVWAAERVGARPAGTHS